MSKKNLHLRRKLKLTFSTGWQGARLCCIIRTLFVVAILVPRQLIAVFELLATLLTGKTFHLVHTFLCW